jgi:hypothetical protein
MKLMTYSPTEAAIVRPLAWLLLAHTLSLLLAPAILLVISATQPVQP